MYWNYLKTLLRHKWFVFLECVKLGMPLTGILHDWSKFLPSEFIPYAKFFSTPRRDPVTGDYIMGDDDLPFLGAWLSHQKRNRHHWQWWILYRERLGEIIIFKMSHHARKEMLADWLGANRAYGGEGLGKWYSENRDEILIHPETRVWIDEQVKLRSDF